MSSLVTEVLFQAGKLDKDDLKTKVSKLSSFALELKKKIADVIDQKYNFNGMCGSLNSLLNDLSDQQNNMQEIQETLAGVVKIQLQDSTSEFEQLSEEHAKTTAVLEAMKKICEVTELLEKFTVKQEEKIPKNSANALLKIQEIIQSIDPNLTDLHVFKFLKESYIVSSENLKYCLYEEWRSVLSWQTKSSGNEEEEVKLKLPCFQKSPDCVVRESVHDLVITSHMVKILGRKIKEFSTFLMQNILEPMINTSNLEPVIKQCKTVSDRKASLEITLVQNTVFKNDDDQDSAVDPAHTFSKVATVLHCIHSNFLCLKQSENEDSESLMSLFSYLTRDSLLELLIKKCLARSIPKTKKELENYKDIAKVINEFETTLRDINYIPVRTEEDLSVNKLTSYAANVSFHFANQRCTDILQRARSIMQENILNTVQIYENHEPVDLQLNRSEKSTKITRMPVGTGFDSQKPSKLLSNNTFKLPKCLISECAQNIIQLAYETLREAATSDPSCAIQLVNTTQNIFELFTAVVPVYHKDSLENIPQLSAIFHNDCMYIAHNLLTLGHQFSQISSNAIKNAAAVSFVHQVPVIRRLGAESLLQQLKRQNDIFIQCLAPLHNFTEYGGADKYSNAEKAMRQVLHLLNHLNNLWNNVLPKRIMQRCMCTLVNSCIGELVSIVCAMEDISADDSVSLKLVCLLLSDQVPFLFHNESSDNQLQDLSWQNQVSRWARLQELTTMLSASLREIVDRWCEGKGPLASSFSITEVKGLIKALFQNTQHRADALQKIRIQ